MKLGLVGSGMIVNELLKFIHDIKSIQLMGITSSINQYENIKNLAKNHDIKNVFISYDEMLNSEDIDTVYLGIPNDIHYEYAMKAMQNGKNVISEKPFTSNSYELEKLIEYAKKNKIFLLEAITTAHLPNVKKIKDMLPQLGNIRIVIANFSQYSSRYDDFKKGVIKPAFDWKKSGGALMDLNIYNIHLMAILFGLPNKVKYSANISQNIDTSGIISLEYDSLIATLIGAKDCSAPISISIQGDEGYIHANTPAGIIDEFEFVKNSGEREVVSLNKSRHRMYHEFIDFERVIREKDFEERDRLLDESLITMKIATLARESAGIKFPSDKLVTN